MTEIKTKVLIIGSGPAGYSAGIYAARANLKPLIITGFQKGGQLTITSDVENYPGFADPIDGTTLMNQMQTQAVNVGCELIESEISKVDFSKRPFACTDTNGVHYLAETVIISTGASAKWLGLKSEAKYMGLGVSACAKCDGFFFKSQPVCVVGGGSAAAEEALYLSTLASSVTLIHRGAKLRAEPILIDRLLSNKNIKIIYNNVLEEIMGSENAVEKVKLKSTLNGDYSELECSGVFIAIGHTPATEVFKDSALDLDDGGYIKVIKGSAKTNIKGVFGAGDVADKIYRQAITSAAMGCQAALDAQQLIESETG